MFLLLGHTQQEGWERARFQYQPESHLHSFTHKASFQLSLHPLVNYSVCRLLVNGCFPPPAPHSSLPLPPPYPSLSPASVTALPAESLPQALPIADVATAGDYPTTGSAALVGSRVLRAPRGRKPGNSRPRSLALLSSSERLPGPAKVSQFGRKRWVSISSRELERPGRQPSQTLSPRMLVLCFS